MKLFLLFILVTFMGMKAVNAEEAPGASFAEWLHDLEAEAAANGISAHTIKSALESAMLDERVIAFDQAQPEQTVSFETYVHRTVTPQKIEEGRALLARHFDILHQLSDQYGVPPEIIVALWGIESSYGKSSGRYNVVDSLLTLAFESRRPAFFRKELMDSLYILDREHLPATALRGSWAGAMGQCQFMPSTYLKYAVDYDGDGRKDIWSNYKDVFASIANYLVAEGWKAHETWGQEAKLSMSIPADKISMDQHYSLSEWQRMGVFPIGKPLSLGSSALEASLIQPDGEDGRSFLVYDNFNALMRWNHSTYFAISVGLLADRIK